MHWLVQTLAALHCSSILCECTTATRLTSLYGVTTCAKDKVHFNPWTTSLNKSCKAAVSMQKSPAPSSEEDPVYLRSWGSTSTPHYTEPGQTRTSPTLGPWVPHLSTHFTAAI